ncbi:PEPxxWA-CTERM sorting domain-containing protein [Methylomagnum sp.]
MSICERLLSCRLAVRVNSAQQAKEEEIMLKVLSACDPAPIRKIAMKRCRCFRGMLLAVLMCGAGTARATEIVFDGSMVGTSTAVLAPSCAPLVRLSTLTGTGASSQGAFGYNHTVCLSGVGPIHGTFLFDFLGGNTLLGSVNGAAAATATAGLFDINLAYNILGGTGQFLGATGGFNGLGTVDQRNPPTTRVSIVFAAVPEPATWAMMLLGFGAMGVALSHRRRTQTFRQVA